VASRVSLRGCGSPDAVQSCVDMYPWWICLLRRVHYGTWSRGAMWSIALLDFRFEKKAIAGCKSTAVAFPLLAGASAEVWRVSDAALSRRPQGDCIMFSPMFTLPFTANPRRLSILLTCCLQFYQPVPTSVQPWAPLFNRKFFLAVKALNLFLGSI
jgi:hypothetical protein